MQLGEGVEDNGAFPLIIVLRLGQGTPNHCQRRLNLPKASYCVFLRLILKVFHIFITNLVDILTLDGLGIFLTRVFCGNTINQSYLYRACTLGSYMSVALTSITFGWDSTFREIFLGGFAFCLDHGWT